MELYEVIWKDKFIEKIEAKHRVSTEEEWQLEGIYNQAKAWVGSCAD